MRELKFRADDGMGWIYSSAVEYREEDDQWLIFDFEQEEWLYCGEPGQYTGLKDKNGREIFEGDVVKEKFDDEYDVGRVVFKDGAFWVEFKPDEELLLGCDSEETEVIGNIHENPELLGDTQ